MKALINHGPGITLSTFVFVLLISCGVSAIGVPAQSDNSSIDGVYEFISEVDVLTEPQKARVERRTPEWSGIWHFQRGYFSFVEMKGKRTQELEKQDVDFYASAGPYQMKGTSLWLKRDYTISAPLVGLGLSFSYRFDGDNLILTRLLVPNVEDMRKGTSVITLKRLK